MFVMLFCRMYLLCCGVPFHTMAEVMGLRLWYHTFESTYPEVKLGDTKIKQKSM